MDLSSVHMLTLAALESGSSVVTSSRTNKAHDEEQHNQFDHVEYSVFHLFAFRFLAARVGFRPAGTRFLVRGAATGVAFRLRIWW